MYYNCSSSPVHISNTIIQFANDTTVVGLISGGGGGGGGGGGELSISSQVTARASQPPNFIFPSSPVRQWVLISRRTPARCSRPDNLTFSSLLLCEAYPSNTASIELPSDVGESFPARQTYFFDPAAFTLLSKPVRLGEPRSPDRRRREHSRPDNLAFSSPTLGEDYPSDTESLDLPSDVGESLPARQTHLFRPLVPQYRTPIEFYIPDWSSNLSFQSTTGEA